MTILIPALLLLHGLVHLLGFAKAFRLAQLPGLRMTIGKIAGVLWLLTGLLLTAGAALRVLGSQSWWAPAAAGILLSQLLIFLAWKDARFGTALNILLLIPVASAALTFGPWSFRAAYDRDVAARFQVKPPDPQILTESSIGGLPVAVQRYLRFTGAVGKPRVWNYRVRFKGSLRNDANSPWMSIVADQQSFIEPQERLFLVDASRMGVPFTALHRYIGPSATFEVSLASLFTAVEARGPEMNQSETVTLLNDMCLLAPATLIDRAITWEELDPQTVRASFTNAGNSVSAVLSFDSSGALTNFVSEDRYRTADGITFERLRWSTPVSEWQDVGGRKLPLKAEALWGVPGSDFSYARFEITEVDYNRNAP